MSKPPADPKVLFQSHDRNEAHEKLEELRKAGHDYAECRDGYDEKGRHLTTVWSGPYVRPEEPPL